MLCVVDNVDTSQIEYVSTSGAPWSFVQDPLGNSLSKIDGLGSAVLRFTGSSVTVYGAVMPTGSNNGTMIRSQYTLDQQTPNTSAQPTDWVWTEQNESLFWTSGNISYGDHILVINVTQASTFAPYYLDYYHVHLRRYILVFLVFDLEYRYHNEHNEHNEHDGNWFADNIHHVCCGKI
ncbi:hypothetical protein A0H81_03865 [Grifola frondosa]|uniref:Uncharacterized protein n=1 Tax=Grifola frondosa TaxID=5627 RepID=A0A1C7MJU2_GRIFR|nr:hypothetical protein A0H81_03865 [Grifola frondosa]